LEIWSSLCGEHCLSDIVYDLYTLVRGKWILLEEYTAQDLGRAITAAKKLMQLNEVDAVGIVREDTDSRTGSGAKISPTATPKSTKSRT
jgi:hypothetical protein